MGMRALWIVPLIAGILILGTLGLSQEAFSFKSSFDWEPTFSGCGQIFCPMNFTNTSTTTFVIIQQIQFQLDVDSDKKGLQPLTFPLAVKLAPQSFIVINFPLKDLNGDPIEITRTFLVSVTAEEIEPNTLGTGEEKVKKTVSNKPIKP